MSIVKDEYVQCGWFESGSGDSFIVLKFDGVVVLVRSEVVVWFVFMELSIDVVVEKNVISEVNVGMFKEWIEVQVFQFWLLQLLQFSKEFMVFFEYCGKGICIEVMKEVWGVMQLQIVQEIVVKFRFVMFMLSCLECLIDYCVYKLMEC